MKIGDKVRIILVDPFTTMFQWAHGKEGTIAEINGSSRQPYFVQFPTARYSWNGLWCAEVVKVYEEVVLPKELFEI